MEADNVYLGGGRVTRAVAPPTRPVSLPPPSVIRGAAWELLPCKSSAAFPTQRCKPSVMPTSPPGALVHTDGTPAFHVFGEGGRTHVATVTGGKRPERERGAPFFNVNTLISNLSTALKATYKLFSPSIYPIISRDPLLDH